MFQPEDQTQVTNTFALLRHTPEVIMYYLNNLVFPTCLDRQRQKLSSCGVDLGLFPSVCLSCLSASLTHSLTYSLFSSLSGSSMLFGVRLGFSGTPSQLLPSDLRPCHFEKGSEAAIVRVLTSPSHVGFERIKEWTVKSLLEFVANHDPPFCALIDTGALITGMSNLEVTADSIFL
jgi:hypothetical protein